MIDSLITLAFLLQVLRISIPYALPAMGATLSERGGVVNIGLEGILLISSFATIVGTYLTGSALFGAVCGVVSGVLTAALHGIITVRFKADQIVSGIGINLFAIGITKFSCQLIFNSSSNSARTVGIEQWGILPQIPILNNPFMILTVLLLFFSNFLLYRTRFGLRLRAVGEHPEAADTVGVNVGSMRMLGVLLSGAYTGLAGGWLALDQHNFTDGMSAGRGFIALAAMIIGRWTPTGALLASVFFGFSEALSIQLQGKTGAIQFFQVFPYVLTMVVLISFVKRAIPPAADGVPYEKN